MHALFVTILKGFLLDMQSSMACWIYIIPVDIRMVAYVMLCAYLWNHGKTSWVAKQKKKTLNIFKYRWFMIEYGDMSIAFKLP